MVAFSFHLRCLVFFFILIQYVSLYKLHISDDDNLPNSSFDEEPNSLIQEQNMGYPAEDDSTDEWKSPSKRSIPSRGLKDLPQRRNNRPHWNPLVAAYKRCGEFVLREERESCFKDAVQMLFVHRL